MTELVAARGAGVLSDGRSPRRVNPKRPRSDDHGDQTYESLARNGETMTTALATYAYDQIDQARAELDAVSKKTTFAGLEGSSQFCFRIGSGGGVSPIRCPAA